MKPAASFFANRYEYGRVSEQMVADGSVYRYRYVVNREGDVEQTQITTPNGAGTALTFDPGRLVSKSAIQGSRSYALPPVIPVQTAILDCLCQVFRGDASRAIDVTVVKVGYGARHFEDAVVSAGAQAHAAHGHFEGALACCIQFAEFAQLLLRDMSIVVAAHLLKCACCTDPPAHVR